MAANSPPATAKPDDSPGPPTLSDTRPHDYPGLANVVAYAKDIYSGGVPEGDEGFARLEAWGVRTVLSVDGSAPEVAPAHAHHLQYVHLPIEYGGIAEQRKLEIAKAVRDLPRPIYVHCHHGKHRSAGAAAAATATLGLLTPEQAVARMKVSGTAPNYKGLYSCAAGAGVVLPEVLDALAVQYVEVSQPKGTTKTMVEIDEANEKLKQIQAAGWQVPPDHPDLVPAAEAGNIADHLRFLLDSPETKKHEADFSEWLKSSDAQATDLEDAIVRGTSTRDQLDQKFKTLNQSCVTCHAKYRDGGIVRKDRGI